jgi:hypothetical protein
MAEYCDQHGFTVIPGGEPVSERCVECLKLKVAALIAAVEEHERLTEAAKRGEPRRKFVPSPTSSEGDAAVQAVKDYLREVIAPMCENIAWGRQALNIVAVVDSARGYDTGSGKGQRTRITLWRCPVHGLIQRDVFDPDEEEGDVGECPVPTYHEEACGERLELPIQVFPIFDSGENDG